ncbi:probable starch synthase 4, chloroplastic/amyloplastic isoform X1 [Corylus avellana]|uniref:probable starch synthase 4, chloroplastic/amyloplastic isoform X1 n=1 Tax=Corylus avellana TaxID=13451 RepID=UPI00286A3599|nr:probable starch synthase 4, chloroplastic/amyloplastic isoform X1 [Corylus avellana]
MLTATSLNAAIPSPLRPPYPCTAHRKPVKARAVCCLRSNGDANSLYNKASPNAKSEGHDNAKMTQPSNEEMEVKQGDIWRLFREAQHNILYLNKQRLMAIEELNKANREKQLLVARIKHLEAEKQAGVGKDKLSVCWELLLRLDSLVLTGMISTGEASDLRRLVMDQVVGVADASNDILQKNDAELLAELRHFSDRSKKTGFRIVHICTEMEPLVSVGSLASYVTGLSCALQRKGHLVEVILPKYTIMDLDEVQGLREIDAEYYSYFNGQLHGNKIWTGVVHGIGVSFIQPLYYSSFFNREKVYGYSDDFERFTYFSRASLDYIVKSGKQPDVLHIHNRETSIVGPLFWDIFVKQGLGGTRILLTCHDFDSQYLEQPDKLSLCGLDPPKLHRPDRLQDNTKTHLVNILKGGVVYSNKILIMSSIHSKGRIIRSFSHGLEHTLSTHKDKLVIAPCGFDNSIWDPSKDNYLPENYSAEDMKGKVVCRVALQHHLALSDNASAVLVGCIITEVSDIDLGNLKAVVRSATRTGVQFIFMDISKKSSKDRALEFIQELLKDENVRFLNEHDEALSHLVFAGSDIIMCQSFHDPVLQVPLKALKYGAAPIAVTSTDTTFRHFVDHNYESTKFSQFISSGFGRLSLSQALGEIENNPSRWKQKIMDAMAMDFSWDAECYDVHVSAYTAIKNL